MSKVIATSQGAMVQADDVIATMREVRRPKWSNESELQKAIEDRLHDHLKVTVRHKPRAATAAGTGAGYPDMLIECSPRLLIECKVSGDWRKIGEAVAQLTIYGRGYPAAMPVVVLGSPPSDVALRGLFDRLGITLVECC